MATPEFVLDLRKHIGHAPLWLIGCTAVVVRPDPDDPDEELVLVVRRADNLRWGPVTGIVDPGEHPAAAAVRETWEETAITAEVERLAQVGVTELITFGNGDQCRFLDHTFRCRYVHGEPAPADGENTEVRWARRSQFPPMPPHALARVDAALAAPGETRLIMAETD